MGYSDAMRRLAAVTLFSLLLWGAAANTPGSVQELAPGVFVRLGNRDRNQPANCGWVVFKDYVLVIDANFPWGAKEILPEIRKTTNKPIRFVFNTHYHGDHAYGSSQFVDQGATLVCSQACGNESRTKGQAGWNRSTATGEFSLKPYRLEHPTLVFEKSMVFEDGDKRVELQLAGPGHSKGDAIAWLPKEKILFTGDLCVNWKSGNNVADVDADHDNWLKALTNMHQLTPKTVVVGHGELGGADVLMAQHGYLAEMLGKVRSGIQGGKTADQLAAEIDLSKHTIGADRDRNATSVRAIYRKLKP